MRYLFLILAWLTMPAVAGNVDCRNCHLYVDPANPAPDFTEFFNNVHKEHHATGVAYPRQFGIGIEFNQPDGLAADIVYFDANHNGQPDANEVQLFGGSGNATVECASCHIEHGTVPRPAGAPATTYLRVDNANSALCSVCHRY